MNVLLVHNFYQQPGGEDQVFADEGKLLEQYGHTVGRWTVDNDDITQMGRVELARKTIWNTAAQGILKEKIGEIRADVVHFHNTFPLISPAAYSAAHEAGAAVVQTLHNYRLMCPAATFCRDGKVCEKCHNRAFAWPSILHKCYRGNRAATAVAAAMLYYHKRRGTYRQDVDAYIALTAFAARKFVEGGLPEDKIVVKSNFVSPDPGIGEGAGDFALFVGRLTEEKGVKSMLAAWKAVPGSRRLSLKIIGDGPLRDEVESSVRENDRIEYLGRQRPEEVYRVMGMARVLIFPSQWYEGQPRTIIEALAKGTPVIASRLGSMPELIEDGRTGLLFEPGDPADLARKVERFGALEASEVSRMRQAARAEFQAKYTAERNYSQLMMCYERALGKPVPTPVATGF